MVFCPSCGEKLPDDANFCSKCGVRTRHGVEAGVSVPADEWREAFTKMGQEMEKAFQTAAREIQKAFKTARENVRETRSREFVVCKSCGEKTTANAVYCASCGKKLE